MKPMDTGADSPSETADKRRCVYCGAVSPIVWVHGHGQCAGCGINVEECCRGEQHEKVKGKGK